MTDFDPNQLPDLDVCVRNALQLFADPSTDLPQIDFGQFERPLVVGSGNAIASGQIMFADKDAVFANESTYEGKLDAIDSIDGVFLLSASGGKHAPMIARDVRARGLKVILLTCNPAPLAKDDVDEFHVFPSLPEPYTYNTSTYMGMILAGTPADPQTEAKATLEHIDTVVAKALADFGRSLADFDAFYLLVPEEFDLVRVMLDTKFIELFGRRVPRDVFTWEQAKHATTVVEADKELFIAFGRENDALGNARLNIPLPANAGYATMMGVGYYVVGKLQSQKPAWFKESIASFTERASTIFGQTIKPIVTYK